MSVTAAIRQMLAAGLTMEQALIAAEAFEANSAPTEPVLTKRQARNKRHYERLKASENRLNKTIKTHSDGGAPASSPVPLSSPPTTPPIIPQTSSPSPETKRATRLSADWVLPAAWGRWALDQGFSEASIRLEADKFRDFWCSKSGKDATKLDWLMTWRNWMRNSGSKARTTGPPVKPKSEFMQHQDDVQRILDQATGRSRHDQQFTGDTLDLGSGDYRAV